MPNAATYISAQQAHRDRRRAFGAATIGICLLLAVACSSAPGPGGSRSTASGSSITHSKLIIFALSFPCGLTQGTAQICAGATKASKALPAGYKLQMKSGINFSDNVAFNSLIQTSLQLKPAGLIVFPIGPAAQTPILNQACNEGAEIVIIESAATGVKCQSTFVHPNAIDLGASVGKWLTGHPPASKEVGVVTQPPGQFASTDDRVKGFTQTVEAAGYKVVATAVTDQILDKTRTEVTNMVTAHPAIGAIFSANGPIGQGTEQALKNNHTIKQLSLDFDPSNIPSILKGTLSAVGEQDAFAEGELAAQYMYKVLQGESVPPVVYSPLMPVVDKTNVNAQQPSPGAPKLVDGEPRSSARG
jgi:ribose transport system substrate-binding protein